MSNWAEFRVPVSISSVVWMATDTNLDLYFDPACRIVSSYLSSVLSKAAVNGVRRRHFWNVNVICGWKLTPLKEKEATMESGFISLLTLSGERRSTARIRATSSRSRMFSTMNFTARG